MKIIDIALKDFIRNFRSPFALGMMFVLPLLIVGLIYAAFGGMRSGGADLPVTKVVVVNQDAGLAGQPDVGATILAMLSDPSVSKWLQVSEMTNEAEARQAVNQQKASLAVIIPADFTQSMLTGTGQAQLLLIQDPTLSIGPTIVREMIASVIDGTAGARAAIQVVSEQADRLGLNAGATVIEPVVSQYSDWYVNFQRELFHSPQAPLIIESPAPTSADQAANPMSVILAQIMAAMMIFFSFYTGAFSMMSILREEEEGTLMRLFTTPTRRINILSGKCLAVFLMVIVQSLVMLAAGKMIFGIQWGQSTAALVVTVGQVVAATGLGVLLISVVKSTRQAGPILGGGLSAMGMISGLFTVQATSLPAALNTMALLTPQGWALRGWKLCLAGGSLSSEFLPGLILAGMGLVMFLVGFSIFRRRYA